MELKPYYQDSAVTIYHGDCREILPQLEPVDSTICDPPYGVDIAEWDAPPSITLFQDIRKITSGLIVFFGGAAMRSINEFVVLGPDRLLLWIPRFTLSHTSSNGMAWRFHPIWCWNLPKDQKIIPWDYFDDATECGNWWEHKCTKPYSLMKKLVNISGSSILDPFMGSGTTLLAAKDLGRKAIGIEIEEKYCEIAARRMAQEVLNLAV